MATAMMRLSLVTPLLGVLLGASPQEAHWRPSILGYQAARCRIQKEGTEAACTDHVKVWSHDGSIACDKLVGTLKNGMLVSAICTGNVKVVTLRGLVASSPQANYDGKANEVQLTGGALAQHSCGWVRADTITVHLLTGDVTAEGGPVRGAFQAECRDGGLPAPRTQ